jgi:nicotinate dehydrogenase subunit A
VGPENPGSELADLHLDVNGAVRHVRSDPAVPLLEVLRNALGLTAAKMGCSLEQCFACAVIVDGAAVPSCTLAIEAVGDRRVITLEGLSDGDELHPVQRAFLEEEAAQCGYCIPGMIMGAVALLERTPEPSDAEIGEALSPHLCRCGTHNRIRKAVRRAAHK